MPTTPISITASELVDLVPFLSHIMGVKLREEIDDEVTMVQFRVLTRLQERPITLSELAEQRHVSRQAASLQVQGLVERGWVRRIPDPNDRRQARLEVTDEGLVQLGHARQALTNYLADLLETLNPEEMAALRIVIPAFERMIEQARADRKIPLEE